MGRKCVNYRHKFRVFKCWACKFFRNGRTGRPMGGYCLKGHGVFPKIDYCPDFEPDNENCSNAYLCYRNCPSILPEEKRKLGCDGCKYFGYPICKMGIFIGALDIPKGIPEPLINKERKACRFFEPNILD